MIDLWTKKQTLKFLCTVRPHGTRPRGTRTLLGHGFEIGPKFFLIHWFLIFFFQIHGFLWFYIFFSSENALFLSFYFFSYIRIHCFLLGFLVISFHNLGETPHHEAAVNGHSNESTCILNHLKSVHFWLTHINLFNKKDAFS